jgi:hypothetical protein
MFQENLAFVLRRQGCQIFLGTPNQNGEKYTKLPQNIPNVHSVYQMAVK